MADLVAAVKPYARQLGKTKLYAIEQGRGDPPSDAEVWAIATACGLDPDWFANDLHEIARAAITNQLERELEAAGRRARTSGDSSEANTDTQGGPG